jgi:hypothetical protein
MQHEQWVQLESTNRVRSIKNYKLISFSVLWGIMRIESFTAGSDLRNPERY